MKVYDAPLTEEECLACTNDDKITVVLRIPFSDIIDAPGLDGFENLVNEYFPSRYVFDIDCEIIGFESGGDEKVAKGFALVKVHGDVD